MGIPLTSRRQQPVSIRIPLGERVMVWLQFGDFRKIVSIRIPLGERVMVGLPVPERLYSGFNSHPARRAGDGKSKSLAKGKGMFQFASRSESG